MTDDLVIDLARPDDAPAIHAIEAASFPTPWTLEMFEREIAASHRMNLVARRGGVVIGYLTGMWFSDELHLNKMAVAVSERRKGIAEALMRHSLVFGKERGVHVVLLEVRKSNPAQNFYRRLGWRFSSLRPHYYPDGEAAIVMTQQI